MRDLVDDVHRSLTATFTTLAEVAAGEVVRDGAVVGAYSGLPASFFNQVHAWRGDGDLHGQLERVVARGDELGLAFQVMVPAEARHAPLVERFAASHGLRPPEGSSPGMALASLDAIPTLLAGVTVEAVTEPALTATVAHLTAASFDLPLELAQQVTGPGFLDRPDLRFLVLRRDDGEAVASALVVVTDDVAGIFNVGVPAAFRRRGYGATVTWEAIRAGRDRGARVAVLEATPMGEPVYRRMGFETVTRILAYTRVPGDGRR